MLWPELGLHIKFLMVVGLSGLMIFSCCVVVCFIIPDSWMCLRFWPGANDNDDEEEEIWIKRNVNGISRRRSLSKVMLRNQNQKEFIDETITSEENITKPSAILLDESKIVNESSKCTTIHRASTTDYSSGSSTDESGSVMTEKDHDHHQHSQPATDGAGEETLNGPQLHLTLQWDRRPIASSLLQQQKLIVEIEKGTDLPWRYYARTVDPSVSSVRLEEVRKSRSGLFRNLLNRNSYKEEAEGRIIVQVHPSNGSIEDNSSAYSCIHDRNPHFQQTIQLSFPVSVPIQDCRLVIVLADNDKLIGIRELGRCRIDLDSVNHHQDEEKIDDAPKLIHLVCPISIATCQKHFKGEIYLGLSFLPTSQRITVQIDRIKLPLIGKKRDFKARIRLYLLNEAGRLLKKRKTLPLECSTSPVNTSSGTPSILLECNELFHLDVGIERWEKTVILAVLMIGDVADVYQPKGFVALGKAIQGSSERIHWESAFQAPRQIISQWHSFR